MRIEELGEALAKDKEGSGNLAGSDAVKEEKAEEFKGTKGGEAGSK